MKKTKFFSLTLIAVMLAQSGLPAIAEVQNVVQSSDASEKNSLQLPEDEDQKRVQSEPTEHSSIKESSVEEKETPKQVENETTVKQSAKTQSSSTENKVTDKKTVTPRALTSEKWGTSPWTFDSTTGELKIGAGTLGEGSGNSDTSTNPSAPWNRTDSYKVDPQAIKKITLTGKVIAPKISSYLFSVDGHTYLSNLTQISGLANLDTSQVTSMQGMFIGASSLMSLDLSMFNTTNVVNMRSMFDSLNSLTNLNVSSFDTSKVTTMWAMFKGLSNLTALDVSKFNTSQVTKMSTMFAGDAKLSILNLSNFDTSKVTEMDGMFAKASSLSTLNLSSFTTAQVTDSSNMFQATALSSLTLGTNFRFKGTEALGTPIYPRLKNSATGNWTRTDGTSKGYTPTDFMANYGTGDLTAGTYGAELQLWGTSPWSFDATTGELTIDAGALGDITTSPWNRTDAYKIDPQAIKKITLTGKVIAPKSSNFLFASDSSGGLKLLSEIRGLSNLDTSQVTSMKGMFFLDSSLKTLDLSSFNTTNVTTMQDMFNGASNLTSLNLSSFDTSKVTTMWAMFKGLSNLTSLDVSHFNTTQVTDMKTMFALNSKLKNLDLSNFDTSKVTQMSNMFNGASSLTSLNLANFDTSLVTTSTDMFKGVSLSSLTLGAKFKFNGTESLGTPTYSGLKGAATGNWTRTDGKSKGYTPTDFMTNYGTGDLTAGTYGAELQLWGSCPWAFDATTGELTIDGGKLGINVSSPMMTGKVDPKAIKKINFIGKVLLPASSVALFWGGNTYGNAINLTEFSGMSNLDTSQVTNMSQMFYGTSSLTTLDLSSFNTSQVTDMSYMFYGTSSLTTLNVSSFDTSKVTNMSYMFDRTSSLSALDLSSFNTSQVTNMAQMFYGTSSLSALDLSSFNTSQVTDMSGMFYGTSSLSALDLSSFNTSQVTTMQGMFLYANRLTTLDVSSFDTSQVNNMDYMFYDTSSLTSLNLANFDTSLVTTSTDMFKGVSLSSLTLGAKFKFKGTESLGIPTYSGLKGSATGNWTRTDGKSKGYTPTDFMTNYGTGDLTAGTYGAERLLWGTSPWSFDATTGELTIDAGTLAVNVYAPWYRDDAYKIDPLAIKKIIFTGKVITPVNSSALFWIDGGLKNLTEFVGLSNLDTSQTTNMLQMFRDASSLSALDLSSFNTSQVTNMSQMFYGTSSLTSLDLSSFNTANVTSMKEMFRDASSLTSLDVSNFDTSQVTNMQGMFFLDSSLKTLDLSSFNTTNVTTMQDMFNSASNLTSLNLSSFDTSKVTNMWAMFKGLSNLTSLDVSHFNTVQVTDMRTMFALNSKLKNLDLSNFDTSKVTQMSNMFNGVSSLTSLNLANFDTSLVTTSTDMFKGVSLSSLTLGAKFKFKGTESLGAPIYSGTAAIPTGKWIREDGQSKGYSPVDFMTNYGTGDLTSGVYVAELEHASLSIGMTFDQASGTATVGNTVNSTITITNDSNSSGAAKAINLNLDTLYSGRLEGSVLLPLTAQLIEIDEKGVELSSASVPLSSELTLGSLQPGHSYKVNLKLEAANNTSLDSDSNYHLSVNYLSGKDSKTTETSGVYRITSGSLSFDQVPDNLEFPTATLSGNKMVQRKLTDWSFTVSDLRGTNSETLKNPVSPRTNWDVMATVTDFKDDSGNVIPSSTLALAYVDAQQNVQELSSDSEVMLNHHEVAGETPLQNKLTSISWKADQGLQAKINNYQLLKKETGYHAQLNLDLRQAP